MKSSPKYFDIHAHVNFAAFDADRDTVVKRAHDAGVWMINVGTQKDTSKKAVELAEKYERGVYAIVGLHPIHTGKSFHDKDEIGEGGQEFTSRGEEFDYKYYKKLAIHPKVVAIGECGLDYYRHDTNPRMNANDTNKRQEKIFIKQIELANELRKPLMLHVRNGENISAYKAAAEILKKEARVGFNFHFFAGNLEETRWLLDLGAIFSFTGVITFARNYDEIVKYLPLERILSETDSPYVAPAPYRGKRNEPAYVVEVVKKIAEIRSEDEEKVRAQILKNAEAFFGVAMQKSRF